MIRKTLYAVALGFALAGGSSTAAKADVDISINLGFGGFYGRNISCGTGARIVAQRFNRVVARDCKGSRYDYTGRRNGKRYWISVSSSTGRITNIVRVR